MRQVWTKGTVLMMTGWGRMRSRKGMEMVQVAILVAIAIGLGLIFRTQITKFVNDTFQKLINSGF